MKKLSNQECLLVNGGFSWKEQGEAIGEWFASKWNDISEKFSKKEGSEEL